MFHQSHPPAHMESMAALIDLGNTLFREGKKDEALNVYEAALSVQRNPLLASSPRVFQQLQWGQTRLLRAAGRAGFSLETRESPPDTFHEDECDVGPRPFHLPMIPTNTPDNAGAAADHLLASAEASVLYNKALIFHSRQQFNEAVSLYEAVSCIGSIAMSNPCQNTTSPSYQKLVELLMRVHNNLGQIAYTAGSDDAAMAQFETSLVYAQSMIALANHADKNTLRLDYANVLSNWSRVHYMTGNVSDLVLERLAEVLRIRGDILPWNHIDKASADYNLGVAFYTRGCFCEASAHLFQYLHVAAHQAQSQPMQPAQQRLDPIPALTYVLLIKNEEDADSMSQELVRGLRALQEKRAETGRHSSELASILNFIGTLLFHKSDYENALLFFQEELTLEESLSYANGDVSISVTCNNIGRILQELSRLDEAKTYYHRALKPEYGDSIGGGASCHRMRKSQDVNSLPQTTLQLYSAVWYNLGLIHDKLGVYRSAINAFQESLCLRRVMLGNNHADVACLLYNIGVLQMEEQMLKEATASFREALRIRSVASSTGHLNDGHIVQTLRKLASLLKSKGNITGALETFDDILNIQKNSNEFDDDASRNMELGTTLREIAELHHAQGDLDMANAKAQESLQRIRRVQVFASGSSQLFARTEEMVAGLLFLGSLNHEMCEPLIAQIFFEEAHALIKRVQASSFTEFAAMMEVTGILASSHCAPVA